MTPAQSFATDAELSEALNIYALDHLNGRSLSELFTFGYDGAGHLQHPSATDNSLGAVNHRQALCALSESYSHMPGQLQRVDKFAAFADLGPRAVATFRHGGYHSALPDRLLFHGLLLAALSNPESAPDILGDAIDEAGASAADLQAWALRASQAVTATGIDQPATDQIAKLQQLVDETNAQGEPGQLAEKLDLGFTGDWNASVTITDVNDQQFDNKQRRSIYLQFAPNMGWHLRLQHLDAQHVESAQLGANEGPLALAPMERLNNFPVWLASVVERLDYEILAENCRASVGRKRSAGKKLIDWALSEL